MRSRRKGTSSSGGWAVLLLIVTAVAGCSSSVATVSGTVSLDGQPLADGTISFLPADGATATAGGPIQKGSYSVTMPPGAKLVRISAMEVIGKRVVYEGDPSSPVIDEVRERIPEQYNAKTTLRVQAAPGSQRQPFELKSTP
jgi:hypothetical protein